MKRYYKKLLRVFFFLVLFFFLLGIFFYLFPVSGKYLDVKLSTLLEREWGRNIDVVGACVYFSKGLITIRELTIYPDQKTGRPFVMEEITLDFSPLALLLSKPNKWGNINLSFPMEIPFVIRDSRIVPGEEFNHIIPLLESVMAGSNEEKENGLSKVHLNFDAVSLAFSSSYEERTVLRPLLKIEKLALVFSLHEGLLATVASEGKVKSELEGDFRGHLTFHPDGTPDHLRLNFSHIFLSEKTLPVPGFQIDVTDLNIKEKIESFDEGLILFHEISIESLSMDIPRVGKTFLDNRIQFIGATEFQESTQFLMMSESKLSVDDSYLILEGGITLSGSHPFSFEMEQTPISPRIMDLISGILLPPQWDMTFQPESLELHLEGYGDLSNIRDTRILGSLQFEELTLRHQDFPLPVTGLKGLVTLDHSDINFSGVTGRFGEGDISLEAHITGSGNFSPPEKISFSWAANLLIQDVLMSLKSRIPLPKGDLEGDIISTGTVDLDLIHLDEITSVSLKGFGGYIEIRNGNLHLDEIPFDIRSIHGNLNVQRDSIDIVDLSGTILEKDVYLSGKVKGDSFFWRNPILTGIVEYQGNLEPLIKADPASLGKILSDFDAKGNLDIKTRISLPILQPSLGSFSGRLKMNNGSFIPDHPSIQGRFENLNADMRFVGTAIFFDNLSGEFAGMPFMIQGNLIKEQVRLDIESRVDLGALRKAIPVLSEDFRASGTVELNCEASFSTPFLMSVFSDAPLPNKPDLKLSGTIQAHNASFAYYDMPVDLTHINGLIRFSEKKFTFDQIKCWCGSSPDCTIDGEVDIQNMPHSLRFQAQVPELYFAEWTDSWQSKDPSASLFTTMQDLTSTSPTMEVDGAIQANKIHFNRLQGDNFQAHFIYNYFPTGPNKLSFDNVQVDVYKGKARASGNLIFPTGAFYYGVEGETEGVDLKPMLSALRGEEDDFTGFITSSVTIAGESGNPDSIRSKIKFDVKQSRFISNVILVGLGKILNSSLLDDITFSRIRGSFEIRDGVCWFQDVTFTSPLVNLRATGTVDLHENVDIISYLVFERKNIFSLPVFKQLAGIIESMGKAFLKFRITGSLENPQVKAIPLSTDEFKKFLSWF